MLTMEMVKRARENIAPFVVKTPLVYSDYLSKITGKKVYLKLESQQITSSFKTRPAFNSILSDFESIKKKGVICTSSGNFAQAVSYAAHELGVSAQVVMMKSASEYKKNRTKSFGAEVVECGDTFEERRTALQNARESSGSILVHQYDTFETMAGDATIAMEILEAFSEEFSLISCTSGGGLTAGNAFATKEMRPACNVYGALPHTHSWPIHHPSNETEKTIADALIPAKAGEKTYPIIQKYVDGLEYVDNHEIKTAMRALCFEQRLIVEPGGAAAVAALMANKFPLDHKNIICIISGANIDFENFVDLIHV